MLSGTYSSICIATPVLADLKERDPQYKALAQAGGASGAAGTRAAKRAPAAKAPARHPGPALARRPCWDERRGG